MRQRLSVTLFISLLATVVLALIACATKATPVPLAPTAPTATIAPGTTPTTTPAKSATDQGWQGVLAAARKEGYLNFYTTYAPPELRVAMSKAMKDNYGIKMEWLVAPGAANAERIRVEHKAKQYMADVWWTGFSVLLTKELRAINALQPFTPPVVIMEPGVWRGKGIDTITDERDALTITQRAGILFVINSNIVRPEDAPKSYKDLLDPKWKSKIVMHDPTVPGGGNSTFGLLVREYGLGFWEKIKEQNVSFIRDYGEVGRRVAIGESPVGLGLLISQFVPLKNVGATIKLIVPAEGGVKNNGPMYLINNAPHPNAGKVFLNWALTREGQEMISLGTGDEPIRTDVEYKTHPEIDSMLRSMPKWLFQDWKATEEFNGYAEDGTARKIFGLK